MTHRITPSIIAFIWLFFSFINCSQFETPSNSITSSTTINGDMTRFINHEMTTHTHDITRSINDDCSISSLTPIPIHRARSCISNHPFDGEIAQRTLQALKRFMSLYVYRSINKSSPPPYNINVDLDYELQRILQKSYPNDYEFHSALQKIYIRMRDAHTVYAPPACYSAWAFYLPFPLTSKLSTTSGEQEIFVAQYDQSQSDIPRNYTIIFPQQSQIPTQYYGWKVLKINNQDALSYLINFSNENCGYSMDEHVRFNQVLKQTWHERHLMRDLIPESDRINYLLQKPNSEHTEEIQVDFYAISAISFTNGNFRHQCGYDSTYTKRIEPQSRVDQIKRSLHTVSPLGSWSRNTTTMGSTIHSDRVEDDLFHRFVRSHSLIPHSNVPMMSDRLLNLIKNTPETDPSLREYARKFTSRDTPSDGSYTSIFISSEGEFEVLKKKDSNVGVLRVTTFMPHIDIINPDNATLSSKNALTVYVHNLQKSILLISKSDIKRLIVDFRGNTGGIICFGWLLVYYLSPYSPKDPSPNSDIIYSELGKQTHCSLFFDQFQMARNNRQQLNAGWFENGPSIERGGDTSKYSEKVILSCQMAMLFANGNYRFESPIQFEPENLIILTSGDCGSTCGMTIKVLQSLNLARIVSMGGIHRSTDQEMSIASFKGAAVMLSPAFYQQQQAGLCNITKDVRVPPLPSNSIVTWSWLESYPISSHIAAFELDKADTRTPLEFIRKPADFHIYDWRFLDNNLLYSSVDGFFDKCAQWEIKRSESCKSLFKGAVFGHPCKFDSNLQYGTSFDESKCVLRGCASGLYLSEDKKSCKKMPFPYDPFAIFYQYAIYLTIIASIIISFVSLVCITTNIAVCGVLSMIFIPKRAAPANVDMEMTTANPISEPPTAASGYAPFDDDEE